MGYIVEHPMEVLGVTGQHLLLVAVSSGIAVVIGIPLGILLTRQPRWSRWILGLANVIQTIPSLALFGFLIPLPFLGGIGARTAIIALILYSLLPIIQNTVTGILGVDPGIREAARGMGMTDWQLLWLVEFPLAKKVIMAGVRVATVISVGVATIAAAIGAGGLGMYIFRGVSRVIRTLDLRIRSFRQASLKGYSSHAFSVRCGEIRWQNYVDPGVTYKDSCQKAGIRGRSL